MGKQHKQATHLKKEEEYKWLRNKWKGAQLYQKSKTMKAMTYHTNKEKINENAQLWQGYGGKSLSYSGTTNINLYNFF